MPRFNSRGDWCAGVGGDGVYLVVNGQKVDPGPGGAGDWLNDDEIACARWTTLADFRAVAISHTGVQRLLRPGAINKVYAGGGRWGVASVSEGFLLDNNTPSLPIVGFGKDGALVTWAHGAGGFIIAGRKVSDAAVYDSHVIDANTAIWLEPDGPHTIGMPVPKFLPGRVDWLRVAFDGVRWWALYESESIGRLVLHPFESFTGYVLNAPFNQHDSSTWAYRPDLVIVGGTKHVIWATVESELLGQIAGPYVAEAQFELQDLHALTSPPPPPLPPPPPPPPPPQPKPEPLPVSTPQAPNEFAVVQRVFAAHPEIDRKNEDTRGRAVDYVIAELGGKPWGRKARNRDGTNLNTDGLVYLRTDGKHEIYDIIDGNSGGATWDGDGTAYNPGENGYWAPGVPVDGKPSPGNPPSSSSSFAGAAAALEARIAGIAAAVVALTNVVDGLKANQHEKEPVNLDGARIALRTDNGHFISAQDGGGGVLHAQRPVPGEPVEGYEPGGWETFTVVAR